MSVSFNENDPEVFLYPVDDPVPSDDTSRYEAAAKKRNTFFIACIIGSLLSIVVIIGTVGGVMVSKSGDDNVPSTTTTRAGSAPSTTTTRATNPSPQVRSVSSSTTPTPLVCHQEEKTCHRADGTVSSCASAGDSCPCPDGQKMCTPTFHTEFYRPRPSRSGEDSYCDVVCCEPFVEERCEDENTKIVSCIQVAEGGCPITCKDGEVECGIQGCVKLCCGDGYQTCFTHDTFEPYCAAVADGGCPCPEGKEKCNGNADWAGYCVEKGTCCANGEESCTDIDGKRSCKKRSEGGCPPNMSYEYWSSMILGTIMTKGSPQDVSYFFSIRKRMEEVVLLENEDEEEDRLTMLRAEESDLFHTIRLRDRNTLFGMEKQIIS